MVEVCARHPLYRALRPGNLVLEALGETAYAYLDNQADELPIWKMAKASTDELRIRAENIGVGRVTPLRATIGGGSLPGQDIDSFGIALHGDLTKKLRGLKIPVIARMEGSETVIDLRTIDVNDDGYLQKALQDLD